MIEELLGIATRVALGSEFNHRRVIYPEEAIALTQSGETADVLYAMRTLKGGGAKILAITNVPGSTADRIADRTVYIKAGTEVSVAATKSYIAQLVALFQLLLTHPSLPQSTRTRLFNELEQLPAKVGRLLDNRIQLSRIARYISQYDSAFFIGRGINYPTALEGALKLKEVSYIHAEGYAAGELKHGPLALVKPGMPVIAVVIPDGNCDSMLTSMREAKSRKAYIIAIADEEVEGLDELADEIIQVPHTDTLLSPILNVVPMQLLAYYAAVERNCPVDFPRNLAKSVTVE
jgi:glucosamine--fructose-6-phosphate aminotransferase (isomerizing)